MNSICSRQTIMVKRITSSFQKKNWPDTFKLSNNRNFFLQMTASTYTLHCYKGEVRSS